MSNSFHHDGHAANPSARQLSQSLVPPHSSSLAAECWSTIATMLRTQRPHFASQPMPRNTAATEGRSTRALKVSRTSRSERTLQEQTIMARPSLERLQTTFYISRLQDFPGFATGPSPFSDIAPAIGCEVASGVPAS
jgi:hypothetical protein